MIPKQNGDGSATSVDPASLEADSRRMNASLAQPLDTNELVENYADRLFQAAVRRVGRHDIAEDLVQETLLSAVRAADSFRGEASLSTWLHAILMNKIRDFYRSPQRRDREVEEEVSENLFFNRFGIWSTQTDKWALWDSEPEQAVERQQLLAVVRSCIDKLPKLQRAVILQRTIEDQSPEQICQDLGISVTNLWKLMSRARLRLRECLDRNWYRKR